MPKGLGKAYPETPFILPGADNPNWVKGSRVPDVMYTPDQPQLRLNEDDTLTGGVDLCVNNRRRIVKNCL